MGEVPFILWYLSTHFIIFVFVDPLMQYTNGANNL